MELQKHGSAEGEQESRELRRGPWTVEEDFALINYIAHHGEGRWNSLSRCAGLKRTGKSCRLRWLNYLRPDVRRGNITLEEQLLILELHSRWGNRWSKIAQHLPGRTDNEIKNYWRTRVQKHAKQLKCDVNSKQFKDTMRYLWMPRLVERIQAAAAAVAINPSTSTSTTTASCHKISISDMGCQTQQQILIGEESSVYPAAASSECQLVNLPASGSGGSHHLPMNSSSGSGSSSPIPSSTSSGGYLCFNNTTSNPEGGAGGLDFLDQSSSQWINGGEDWYLNNNDNYYNGVEDISWFFSPNITATNTLFS